MLMHHFHPAQRVGRSPALMVLLPPAQSNAADLEREGFVAAVRERSLPLDLLLLDIPHDEITDGSALRQLHALIAAQAYRRQYESLCMAGISIGAYLAIAYQDHFADNIDALCLIAPYPGSRLLWGEIVASGGIDLWQPGEVGDDDHERRVWRWLKQHGNDERKFHLALGSEDRFAKGQEVMASALPHASVDRIPGDHQWPVWRTLWQRYFDNNYHPGICVRDSI